MGFDGAATPVGRYASLTEARRAVRTALPEEHVLSPRVERVMQITAAVTGMVAIGAFGTALLTFALL